MSRGSEHSSEVLPFWNHPELRPSPRIRSLLDGVFQTTWSPMASGLHNAFRSVLKQIHSEVVAPGSDSADWSERQRMLQHCEAAFIQAVKRRLQHSLLALAAPPWADHQVAPDLSDAETQQHVGEGISHREQMLLAQMSARAEVRIGSGLASMAWRLAAIQSAAPAETEDLVLGPYWLATALAGAMAKGPVNPDDRRMLLRGIEQELYLTLPRIVHAADQYLSDHQVLPRIERFLASTGATGFAEPKPEERRDTDVKPAAAPESPVHTEAIVAPLAKGHEAEPIPVQAEEAGRSAKVRSTWDGPATRALRDLATGDESNPQVLVTSSIENSEEQSVDGLTIARIWEFLGQRHSHAGGHGNDAAAPTAASREVLGALNNLQQRSNRQYAYNGRADVARDGDLRRELLNELRELTRTSAPRLSDPDANVIALVGRLFGDLLSSWASTSRVHGLLARLEVPVAKAALLDKSFFMDSSQHARAFLEAVASACAEWIEDEEADRAVVERIEAAVDQLCNAYDNDLSSFDAARGELDKQLHALRKRADISIRRQIEALQGREKLELARLAAREVILASVHSENLLPLIELFLKNAWSDSIALAILRHGIDSDVTRERAEAARTLSRHFANRGSANGPNQALAAIESTIKEGLGAVGFHADAVHGAWRELIELTHSARADQHAATPHLSELAHSLTRLGGGKSVDGPDDPAPALQFASKEIPTGTTEPRPGQWLEVRTYPEGQVHRLLAWRSQVSRRILLADRRGTRIEEWDMGELMNAILANEIRVRTGAAESKVANALRIGLARGERG